MAGKSYYDTLGIAPNATADQIREAYITRSKMFHPDRFDQTKQANEWRLANEMLKELNQAYNVLREPRARAAYDSTLLKDTRSTNQYSPPPRQEVPRQPPAKPPVDLGLLSSGFTRFSHLPQQVRDRISARTSRKTPQQFIVPLQGVAWNYFYLFLSLGWFLLLFVFAQNEKWAGDERYWMLGISAFASLFVATNFSLIVRMHTSPWKCNFIVSPLYFIKTQLDEVWFWPLWQLKDLKATHNYRNGSFTGTDVTFVFDTGTESLVFSQRNAYEEVVSALRVFDSKLRTAKQQGQYDYFVAEDDFRGWKPSPGLKPRKSLSKTTIFSTVAALVVAGVAFLIACEVNSSSFPYRPPSRFAQEQPVSTPSTTARPKPRPQFTEPELAAPASGEVRRYTTGSPVSPLQIQSSTGDSYLVKLDDARTGQPVLSVFVRGGQTEEVQVPLGTYTVKYASGDRWYGYKHLFGPDTQYSKADRSFTFSFDGHQYSGYTVTLYKVRDGNLSTTKISPDDF